MPSFKYKTNKKITVDDKSIVTLDNRHKEMQLHFSNVTNIIIPNLLKEKKELTTILNDEEEIRNIPIEKQLELRDHLNDIKNIFCHYTETINENPNGTLNTENYSKIVPIDIVLLPRNIKYSSFGKTIIPGRNVNQKNCASFAADIFSDRIACRCPSVFSSLPKQVNNNPENCSNLWFANVQNICQQIYMLIFTRSMPITFNQLNTVTNYIVHERGGKKKSRKTMKRKYKKNKKYKKSRKQKK